MRKLLTVTGFALLMAAPAMAQTAQTTHNPYAQEAAQIIAREAQLPGGGDERVRERLEWRAEVVKADADRAGMPIHLKDIRALVASNPGSMMSQGS